MTTTTPATPAPPAGIATAYTYDPAGRVTQTRQSSFATVLRSTSATYTLSGKTATATDANGNVTAYANDLLDRRVKVTDAEGRVTTLTYDAQSRPSQVFNPLIVGAIPGGALASQTYTPNGRRAALTDAGNHTTGFAYDGLDRLSLATYPDSSTESLTYDANILTRTTRAGATLLYGYDTLNRLATKTALRATFPQTGGSMASGSYAIAMANEIERMAATPA